MARWPSDIPIVNALRARARDTWATSGELSTKSYSAWAQQTKHGGHPTARFRPQMRETNAVVIPDFAFTWMAADAADPVAGHRRHWTNAMDGCAARVAMTGFVIVHGGVGWGLGMVDIASRLRDRGHQA